MKKKQWILVLIILLPSALWLILETSTINSKKLPYYGPKKVLAPKDTLYYTVQDQLFKFQANDSISLVSENIDIEKHPLYAICFIKDQYSTESYRMPGLWEYLNYKKNKIEHIPVFLACENKNGVSAIYQNLKKLNAYENVFFRHTAQLNFDSLNALYFKEKPYYVDFSFFVLVDAKRQIRGYYDGRYVAEIKRLIDEYQHLRLKEEKQRLLDKNEIKKEK
ncbi:MAG: hypothetical protein WCR21_00420 [Bacteroidota bacterium]